jgi:hypothetical protein
MRLPLPLDVVMKCDWSVSAPSQSQSARLPSVAILGLASCCPLRRPLVQRSRPERASKMRLGTMAGEGLVGNNMADLTPEQRRAKFRENQNYFSSKISELARYIGFGLVAVSFGLLSSDAIFAKMIVAKTTNTLAWAGLLGVAAVLADYLHLLMGWFSNTQAANNTTGNYKLPRIGSVFRFVQDWIFFYLKQLFPLVGVALLLISISRVIEVPHL